jgi:pimeloyl-ACP methyl ester carboxylesterase
LQRDAPFADERAAIVDGLAACRRRLEAAGIDLGDYDTESSVRDLDRIRAALGYDRWNLLGISYGARLSLAAMRSTPEHLRSVILDSVYDVTGGGLAAQAASAERGFQQLADGCAADPTCHAAHPDVAATISAVRERYNATPIQVDVDLGRGAGPQHWVITGDDAMAGLFNALYDASLIPALPAILDGLAAGDTAIVPELIRRGVGFATAAADGMQMSVDCADNAGLGEAADVAAIADPGRTRLIVTSALCSEWPVPPTSSTFNEPVVSPVPTLVLAGAYDPITPPAVTQAVAARLPHATFGLWPNRGHGVTGDPCALQVESAFLADPAAPVDLGCLARVPGPAFT